MLSATLAPGAMPLRCDRRARKISGEQAGLADSSPVRRCGFVEERPWRTRIVVRWPKDTIADGA